MTGEIDWASTEHARVMGLDYRPKTPVAHLFCDALGDVLATLEHRKNQRRDHRRRAFNLAVGAIAADLLKAVQADLGRWSRRSFMTETFKDAPVSHADFVSVIKAAEAGGFLDRLRGCFYRAGFGPQVGSGRSTRLRATPSLLDWCADHGVTPDTIDEHFERKLPPLPPKPLVLKGSSLRNGMYKIKGREMRFMRTDETDRMEQDIKDLNEFLARHEIDGGTHRG